jgi:hypothetical protein
MFRPSEVAAPHRTLFIVCYLVAVAALFSGSEAIGAHANAQPAAAPTGMAAKR